MRIVASTLLLAALLGARIARAAEGPPADGADDRSAASSTGKVKTPTDTEATKPKLDEPPPASPGELPAFTIPRKYMPRVEIHGSAYLWFNQPLSNIAIPQHGAEPLELSPNDRFLELYSVSLAAEGRLGDFGLYVNPRFRDTKARKFYNSNVWIQEAYAFFQKEYITIKAGKIENAFSRMWDDSFYGSLAYFDGIKLDMDYGVSIEGQIEGKSGLGLAYYAQYFYVDGQANGSLDDRDTLWVRCQSNPPSVSNVDGLPSLVAGRRYNTATARLEPSYRFSPKVSLRLGGFGQFTQAYLPVLGANGKCTDPYTDLHNVFRYGADFSLAAGPVKLFGEFIAQKGYTTLDYPKTAAPPDPKDPTKPVDKGRASANNLYGLGGLEFQVWRFVPRYSISLVSYQDTDVLEILQLPGLTINLHDNVQLMLEYAYWPRFDSGKPFYKGNNFIDNSFNAVLYGKF